MRFRISRHAEAEIERRGLTRGRIEAVLEAPEQVVPAGPGREIHQSRMEFDDGRDYLLRVIVDTRPNPPVVVTAYRTSRLVKYWRTS